MDADQLRALMAGYEKGVRDTLRFMSDALDAQETDQVVVKPPTQYNLNLPANPDIVNTEKADTPPATPSTDESKGEPTTAPKVWPAPKPENPYNPTRPLREAFPYLRGSSLRIDNALSGTYPEPSQVVAVINCLYRKKVTTVGDLVKLSEEMLVGKEFPGISERRVTQLKIALQSLNDEVAENSH